MKATTGDRTRTLVGEFRLRSNPRYLPFLRRVFWRHRCEGDFESLTPLIARYTASGPQSGYNPTEDETLLELHCAAASAYDHMDRPDEVQAFLGPWGMSIQPMVQKKLQELRRPETLGRAIRDLKERKNLWIMRSWMVQRLGVQQYRRQNYLIAIQYLRDAVELSSTLMEIPDESKVDETRMLQGLRCVSVHSSHLYWRGIVHLYGANFDSAEADFMSSLQSLADHIAPLEPMEDAATGLGETFDERTYAIKFARYITSRTLMGLGLLRFHRGELRPAKSTLLAARIMLTRDSRHNVRKHRCSSLLLSVERLELDGREPGWEMKAKSIISRLQEVAEALRGKDRSHFLRARRSEALSWLRLADLYMESGEFGATVALVLNRALAIAQSNAGMADSTSEVLRSELLRMRVYIEVEKLKPAAARGIAGDAIALGDGLRQHPAIQDHPLIYVDLLVALGYACLERFRSSPNQSIQLLTDAVIHLNTARDRSRFNLQTRVLCELYLARVAIIRGELDTARTALDKIALTIGEGAPWIQTLQGAVEEEFSTRAAHRIVIDHAAASGVRAYENIDRRVRLFLLEQLPPDMPMARKAERLGISRQSLYAWQKELMPRGHTSE